MKYVVESLLFAAGEPVGEDQLLEVVPGASAEDVRLALAEIRDEYEARGGGFFLEEVAGGFQLRTRPEFAPYIRKLSQGQPARLSRAALETLAIVAYRQPVMRAEIEHVRGVDSGGVLRMLLEKDLLRVLGKKDLPGRPLVYATSKRFLEVFGLKDLSELPSLRDMEELGVPPPAPEPEPEDGQQALPFSDLEAPPGPDGEDGGQEETESPLLPDQDGEDPENGLDGEAPGHDEPEHPGGQMGDSRGKEG
ncbi:MAG: SMC-Scp complex subunit ScpB [Proteobacteria bacterium]|nr:SMC-Scp complex subunit ScpB [Pseudomonadota bacterium]